ncbi:hypothetical protein ANO11243_035510 [Dothideomycetidae sp. 11243]|nr:hypothetical protein ANO11243_035510 [fungal sp. No.11243]
MLAVDTEAALSRCLRDLPHLYNYRYTEDAERYLRKTLCSSLVLNHAPNLPLLFRSQSPDDPAISWSVRKAQGGHEGAEYTAAARGHACGHIFRQGESSYHCKTCAADDTCVLCARCFAESDHEGHAVFVSVSPGNTGCCDCGDAEAWTRPVLCGIHSTSVPGYAEPRGKAAVPAGIPPEIVEAVRRTIGKALDYMCDVFSCSPEQLRLSKTEATVANDERASRLSPEKYGGAESIREPVEFSLVLWNDEKHTLDQVRDQVARACKRPRTFGDQKARQVDSIGRSIIEYSTDMAALLEMARVLEQIKVSVTVRSSRDTFREQMCETIIGWLSDIHGCSIGLDAQLIRDTICSELFSPWQVGSPKGNETIGQAGIYDHEMGDRIFADIAPHIMHFIAANEGPGAGNTGLTLLDALDRGVEGDDDEEDENDDTNDDDAEDGTNVEPISLNTAHNRRKDVYQPDVDMGEAGEDDPGEVMEATMAGYPPPPPPPPPITGSLSPGTSHNMIFENLSNHSQRESNDSGGLQAEPPKSFPSIPKTPKSKHVGNENQPDAWWISRPPNWVNPRDLPTEENITQRLRIDYLILYDLRLWKTLRDSLRYLYISAVITVPNYKRLLGIRFAGLYTLLAQLYLIADREPDHSIINLSLQLLTTPSITAEIVEKANFFAHLMAIIYTFLTTRQVGYPKDVRAFASLAFDAGAITNRRMFHFFVDARYMIQAAPIQSRLRADSEYIFQFLDIVKLHQGICPNVRAVGEHVEYETDTWLSASMIIKEVNRLSRLVADAYFNVDTEDLRARKEITGAIMLMFYETAVSSMGLDWARFTTSEMKGPLQFRNISQGGDSIMIPDVTVLDAHMSFHHPLHYMTSWVLQAGQKLPRVQVQAMFFKALSDVSILKRRFVKSHDWLGAMFDPPLRVCVWLAQMRAGMWVRNGMTLRHQMHSYRNPAQRDVTYQRDIFMLQAGLVLCDQDPANIGERFLLQIIHRYDLAGWLECRFAPAAGYEDAQYLDVIEDFFHLLVILLSERDDLLPQSELGRPSQRTVQRDIAHILCFKPLSYSDLTTRLTERINESSTFDEILETMTNYKAPEGLNDSGTFELRSTYLEMIDPYYAFYNRNQREEADTICREYHAKQKGIDVADVVLEPSLIPIPGGLFKHLAAFVRTESFGQLIFGALGFSLEGYKQTTVELSRVEPVLHLILHLALLAVNEDSAAGLRVGSSTPGFIDRLLHPRLEGATIRDGLKAVLDNAELASCHARARSIIKRAQQQRPDVFAQHNALDLDLRSTPTPSQGNVDKEAKKRAALERQAKVMAQFKAQQSSFMTTQGLDWDVDEFSDEETKGSWQTVTGDLPEIENVRDYPADACILCQEESNEEKLYGCFAFVAPSNIQRQTPIHDSDFVQEVIDTPASLDKFMEGTRPFGIASKNRQMVEKIGVDGSVTTQRFQGLSKGFTNYDCLLKDHVVTSCGHMMHFSCFETYMSATQRRQSHQISRNHPERLDRKEFLCPLCKALGNIFLPVVWKSRKEHYPGILGSASQSFDEWLVGDIKELESRLQPVAMGLPDALLSPESRTQLAQDYIQSSFHSSLGENVLQELPPSPTSSGNERLRAARALVSVLNGRLTDMFAGVPSSPTSPADELVRAYQLLNSSVRTNTQLPTKDSAVSPVSPVDPNPPMALGPILQTIASTIAAVEIQYRGVASENSLLTAVSEQSLAALRIFCETASSMLAMEQIKDARMAGVTRSQEYHCLSHLLGLQDSEQLVRHPTPLRHNVFWALSACSFLAGGDWQRHGHNLIQLALLAEICKTIIIYQGVLAGLQHKLFMPDETEDLNFTAFYVRLQKMSAETEGKGAVNAGVASVVMKRIVERQSLIFLRKVALLTHVRSAVDFAAPSSSLDPDMPELDRLCILLRLPPLSLMYQSFVQDSPSSEAQRRLVKRWLLNSAADVQPQCPSTLDHPAIFELVGLPRTFDALTEEAVRRRCPTTGKALDDPVVCLFCGAIFCSQASCCRSDDQVGGAGQHLAKCGGSVGLFINIRKCFIIFLHDRHGSFAHAPYLDKHGEPDPTLRRHHQLFLNQKRYDRLLRDVWLSHGVPSVISRKLEADVNNGGWETL